MGELCRCARADVYHVQKHNHTVRLPDSTAGKHRAPNDWNNGSGVRYYRHSISQEDIIQRLLMCGISGVNHRDLSSGSIYGFTADGSTGLVDVGIFRSGY